MSERRCILTGRTDNPGAMIRLALGPDGQVMPDVRAKAPGRGAWISVCRDDLQSAMVSGRFKGALSRAFKTGEMYWSETLADQVEQGLRGQLLDRFGLESRSSMVITGSEKIETAARKGQVHLLLHASDAAPDGCRKLDQAWRVGMDEEGSEKVGLTLQLDRHSLAMAMGRANVVHMAVVDGGAAKRIKTLLDRWQNYRGSAIGNDPVAVHDTPETGLSAGQ